MVLISSYLLPLFYKASPNIRVVFMKRLSLHTTDSHYDFPPGSDLPFPLPHVCHADLRAVYRRLLRPQSVWGEQVEMGE